jgi:hypothetical protein
LKDGLVDPKEDNATDSEADNTTASTGKWPAEVFFKEFTKEVVCQTEAIARMTEKVPVTNFKS